MWKLERLLLFVILSSCQTNRDIDILGSFTVNKELTNRELITDCFLNPYEILIKDSCIFSLESGGEYFSSLYDMRTKNKSSFLAYGRGPNETQNALRISPYGDGKIQIHTHEEKIYVYNIDSLRFHKSTPQRVFKNKEGVESFANAVMIDSSKIIFCGRHGDNNKRICVYNGSVDSVYSFGTYPVDDACLQLLNENDYSRLIVYQGNAYIKPDKKKAMINYTNFMGFDLVDLDSMVVKKSVHYYYPKYKSQTLEALGINKVVFENEESYYFESGCSNDAGLYFLFFEKNKSDLVNKGKGYLLKYDWDGNPICKYKLNEAVRLISVDEDDKSLYCVIEKIDKTEVVRYDL